MKANTLSQELLYQMDVYLKQRLKDKLIEQRQCNHVAESGTSVKFAHLDSESVVQIEHADRVLLVGSFGAEGELRSSRVYDPVAFIAGVETCTRLERIQSSSSQKVCTHIARPVSHSH